MSGVADVKGRLEQQGSGNLISWVMLAFQKNRERKIREGGEDRRREGVDRPAVRPLHPRVFP